MPKTDPADAPPGDVVVNDSGTAEAKRIAARRRFLRMGAGGSAAVLVTVVHKRAFAGGSSVKKNSVVSHCVSIGGQPDIKHMNQKKALQISAGGTLKNAVCYTPKNTAPANTCGTAMGKDVDVFERYMKPDGKYDGRVIRQVPVYSSNQMKNGCGDLEDMLNSQYQVNYRLYKKHYCPVRIVGDRIEYYPPGTTVVDKDGNILDPCADRKLYE